MKSKKMNKGVKLYNRKSSMIAGLYTCKKCQSKTFTWLSDGRGKCYGCGLVVTPKNNLI